MRLKRSEYMHWAKTQQKAAYTLATSGVGAFPLRELNYDFRHLEINGNNSYGFFLVGQRVSLSASLSDLLVFAGLLGFPCSAYISFHKHAIAVGKESVLLLDGVRIGLQDGLAPNKSADQHQQ